MTVAKEIPRNIIKQGLKAIASSFLEQIAYKVS